MSIASLDGADPISSGDDLRELAEEFAALGASVFGNRGPTGADASDLLVRAAVQRVGGAESASITTLARDRFTTTAATDDVARAADEVQYQLRSGPCVDAVVNEVVFQVPNLSREQRWPEYARVATDELGIGSMLSFKLAVDSSDLLAGLNLYAFEPDAFDDHALHTGLLLSTYGALLVNAKSSTARSGNWPWKWQTSESFPAPSPGNGPDSRTRPAPSPGPRRRTALRAAAVRSPSRARRWSDRAG
jgi:hypothetical protein